MSIVQKAGRFAPSPSGDMHIGNLRTATLAWIWARQTGRNFVIRIEDIDRVKPGAAERQLADLKTIGITWDQEPLFQSTRHSAHLAAIETLNSKGLLFECFCSRKEIAEASSAPHSRPGFYPGTCAQLSAAERAEKRAILAAVGRKPALRLRPQVAEWTVQDELFGEVTEQIDQVVLQRGDGTLAYNLVVVVDDAWQQVDQVVRADDLLFSAPAQSYIAHELGYAPFTYAHVPLVLAPSGARLAKRDGAVTLQDLLAQGWSVSQVVSKISASLGYEASNLMELLEIFDRQDFIRKPWVFTPPTS
ncbi:tRNA glutamyl-Q(34) synthetase GluQRS [Gleimia sp. 6138-11-ORH1]|uniref:tRNA glutamyl-Q(34) synthetase GluQRS n=1 Tax=Gleimia sp. 6138-11-ORH1 TaxID=2973937 RepID=UPI002169FACB|nr:tRNA glutamyl-Q(34) synthetase GluQRS [Gleimia sp. 6138-11-ORH1]MCS4484993.1 tRNA glutamyl-Q(34) synthetase GluQRS [Gleimia sp. 6138-11-ORH1]